MYEEVKMNLTFAEAYNHARSGFIIERDAWDNTKVSKYVFMRPTDVLPNSVVAKAVSIPDTVKKLLKEYDSVEVTAYLCLVRGSVIENGWQPSMEDIVATDWVASR